MTDLCNLFSFDDFIDEELPDAKMVEIVDTRIAILGQDNARKANFTNIVLEPSDFISPPNRKISLSLINREYVSKNYMELVKIFPFAVLLGATEQKLFNGFEGIIPETAQKLHMFLKDNFLVLPIYKRLNKAIFAFYGIEMPGRRGFRDSKYGEIKMDEFLVEAFIASGGIYSGDKQSLSSFMYLMKNHARGDYKKYVYFPQIFSSEVIEDCADAN